MFQKFTNLTKIKMISYLCDYMEDRKLTAAEMGRISPEEYRRRPGSGIAVVLDNVRSAYNVGSAFRSADAFGADRMVLCGICSVPPSAEIHKTALGAELSVPWERHDSTLDAVAALRAEGYTIVSVEQTEHSVKLTGCGSIAPETCATLGDIRGGTMQIAQQSNGGAERSEAVSGAMAPAAPNNKYAFIFGNEVEGVQQSVVNASDFCLEIPQHGTKHSLNVAVTVGIVLFATSPVR